MKNNLVVYVRNNKNIPIGCLISILVINSSTGEPFFSLGWSKCHKNDIFNKKIAKKIAQERAISTDIILNRKMKNFEELVIFNSEEFSKKYINEAKKLYERSLKYFKNIKCIIDKEILFLE